MHVGKGEVASRINAAWGASHKHRRWLVNRHVPVQPRLKLFDSDTRTALFYIAILPMTSRELLYSLFQYII